MYIESVPNRNSPPAVLLRESYRDENGRVKKRTLANLSCLDSGLINLMRRHLKGETFVSPGEAFKIVESKTHGQVEAVLEAMRRLKMAELIDPQPSPRRNQVLAMIAARILALQFPLPRFWRTTSLPCEFGLEGVDDDDLDSALDWLLEKQSRIEAGLADEECVRRYKKLPPGERAFRTVKMAGPQIRPLHHPLEGRARARLFLGLLSYYVEWHMREAWRELLFSDEEQALEPTCDPGAPARKSASAKKKAAGGAIVHSFESLLADLSGIVRNVCQAPAKTGLDPVAFTLTTTPTAGQQKALALLKTING
ncbi:MAG: hypothetical protein LBP33_08280 [Candidatus Adiutrix sp.]|jgi:hypothetical protein|nr:hypothetical protein [Candidatus Adiutrix sp.]